MRQRVGARASSIPWAGQLGPSAACATHRRTPTRGSVPASRAFSMATVLCPYDPAWRSACSRPSATAIRDTLGPLVVRLDHHGSTAVPGLRAKPVIDIQVSVRSLDPAGMYAERLAVIGYAHLPHTDDSFAPFFFRPATSGSE